MKENKQKHYSKETHKIGYDKWWMEKNIEKIEKEKLTVPYQDIPKTKYSLTYYKKALELRFDHYYSYNAIGIELKVSTAIISRWFNMSKDNDKRKYKKKYVNRPPEVYFRRRLILAEWNVKGIDTKELLDDIIKNKSFCHICGGTIDILDGIGMFKEKPSDYDFDHIIPKTKKGGSNNPTKNMHPTHRNCNYMKGKMYMKDFLLLTKKIFKYQNKEGKRYEKKTKV